MSGFLMTALIQKKKRGEALSGAELSWIAAGAASGDIPDYQMAAWLMAVCFRGMDTNETAAFTHALADSGDQIALTGINAVTADKHSTGGVGDKTTLIVAPLAAACGLTIVKMSGRALGHTGGTIDKLETIPGFRTELSHEDMLDIAMRTGLCVAAQSAQLAPADKALYALRDVTATVDSIPLIAASVMCKKLAAGAECILLDVKTGSGAFMKTPEEARILADAMIAIGKANNRHTAALVTDMSRPLGYAIGNALEVMEAWRMLQGENIPDLRELCLRIVTEMLLLGAKKDPARFPSNREECASLARLRMEDGSAARCFRDMVTAQGGDVGALDEGFPSAPYQESWRADRDGFIIAMDAESIGMAALALGAGRRTKQDAIDPLAGVVLRKKSGDSVCRGDTLAVLHTSREERLTEALDVLANACEIGDAPPTLPPLVYESMG